MKRYELNILGMSEVRWSEFGEMTTHDGATFIYLGRPEGDNVSREGVGGTHRGNGGEGDLNRRGGDRSTMRH